MTLIRWNILLYLYYYIILGICYSGLQTLTLEVQQCLPPEKKGQGYGPCSVHETECLSSCNLVLKYKGSPRELPILSLLWNLEETYSNRSERKIQEDSRWTCHWKWGQRSKTL